MNYPQQSAAREPRRIIHSRWQVGQQVPDRLLSRQEYHSMPFLPPPIILH